MKKTNLVPTYIPVDNTAFVSSKAACWILKRKTKWEWPPTGLLTTRYLNSLAVEHGIPVISANAHRALDDVMMVIQIIRLYDFESEIRPYWEAERKLLSAKFRKDDFRARAVVKRFGFRWNRDVRQWEKEVRDFNGEIETVRAKLNSIADLKVKVA